MRESSRITVSPAGACTGALVRADPSTPCAMPSKNGRTPKDQPHTRTKPVYHIEIGGKTRPVRFDFQAQREVADDLECETLNDFFRLTEAMSLGDIPVVLLRGLQGGARKEKVLFDAGLGEVTEWLNEYEGIILGDETGLFSLVTSALLDALPPKPEAGAEEGAEGKPNPSAKTSATSPSA